MFIILDQSKDCYDAGDIFLDAVNTKEEVKQYFKNFDKNDLNLFSVLNTEEKDPTGNGAYKEYSLYEII